MKFRETPIDGFFVIHTYDDGPLMSRLIQQHLDLYDADMQDVQYSTHLTQEGKIMNDVLVMYSKREKTAADLDAIEDLDTRVGGTDDTLEGWI